MALDAGALSMDGAANAILSLLRDDDDEDAPERTTKLKPGANAPGQQEDSEPDPDIDSESAPDAADEADDDVGNADDQPPIDPPASWKADAKAHFKALPRDLQQVVVDREREREAHFSKTQSELANAKRAAMAERQGVASQRQALAQGLGDIIDTARTFDPVLADGYKTDWNKAYAQDPAAAAQKWLQFQQRANAVQALIDHQRGLRDQAAQENRRQASAKLGTALDFWPDAGKRAAFLSELGQFLTREGLQPSEVAQVADPRAILIARKAMLYDKLMGEQAKIAAAKRPPAAGRVLRPQARSDDDSNPKAEALMKRARRSGRLDDQAAAILARL